MALFGFSLGHCTPSVNSSCRNYKLYEGYRLGSGYGCQRPASLNRKHAASFRSIHMWLIPTILIISLLTPFTFLCPLIVSCFATFHCLVICTGSGRSKGIACYTSAHASNNHSHHLVSSLRRGRLLHGPWNRILRRRRHQPDSRCDRHLPALRSRTRLTLSNPS